MAPQLLANDFYSWQSGNRRARDVASDTARTFLGAGGIGYYPSGTTERGDIEVDLGDEDGGGGSGGGRGDEESGQEQEREGEDSRIGRRRRWRRGWGGGRGGSGGGGPINWWG